MKNLRVGLIGYGRMGQMIEQLAEQHAIEVVWKIQSNNRHTLNTQLLRTADVVIEMTRPEAAFEHVQLCIEAGVPIVTGTTGWQKDLEKAYALCEKQNGTMLYASNFSIGVNLFFAFNQYLAEKMRGLGLYQPEVSEWHHVHKKDQPSGTAVTIAEGILAEVDQLNGWHLVSDEISGGGSLPIHAYREGEIIGTHTVRWQSKVDEITIRHEAYDRTGFALGALLAAKYIHDKHGVFSMSDVLGV
jgi:4-hydroxy-tetrahydrodipicolinate reductase